jgi:hypothetical protein
MKVTAPAEGQPELFEWWCPLLAVGRRLRETGEPWTLQLDDFAFRGWVKRQGKATLFVYGYSPTGSDVICDAAGNTYQDRHFSNGERSRLKTCERDTAMFQAGVAFTPAGDGPGFDDDYPQRRRPRPWARSRAHLRVVRG